MDANTNEVSECLPRIVLHLLRLWRACPEYCWDIGGDVLKNYVRRRYSTKVAASPSVGHPRRWGVHTLSGKHVIRRVGWCGRAWVENRVGPVGKRNARVAGAIWIKVAEAVADRHPVAVSVHTGKRGQDIGRCMGDERGVVI